MRGALVIFIAMVVIGVILYITDVVYYRKKYPKIVDPPKNAEEKEDDHGEGCCGMHLVCEKTSLSLLTDKIVYYDDEELDRFKGREEASYSPSEIEEFRDVLMTLLPEDVAGWSRSIQLRGINLPPEVKDELLMIVSELRNA